MSKFRMFPFDKVNKGANIAIYGSGIIFDEFFSQVNALDYCNILWVIDKKVSDKYKDTTKNILFCSPQEMDWKAPDYIIIASIEFATEIENEISLRKGNLDHVIRLKDSNIVNIKTSHQDDILLQQRTIIERGNIYHQRTPALIVSLTSITSRIETVHLVIESLIQQSLKADRIILWLGDDVFLQEESDLSILPTQLIQMIPRGLEIRACKDIKSYKKLIPALNAFKGDVIVTADDDILYPSNWLEKLYIAHQKEPNIIHCHQGHRISIDQNQHLLPYSEWDTGDSICGHPSKLILPIGCGGVLYPPNALHDDVMNMDTAMLLCPTGDDLWFKTMSLKNNVKAKVLSNRMDTLTYVSGTQDISLCEHNLSKDENKLSPNDYQLRAALGYYNLLSVLNE